MLSTDTCIGLFNRQAVNICAAERVMTGFAGTLIQGGCRLKQHPGKEKIHSCTLNFHDKTGGKIDFYFIPRLFF